MKTSTLIVIIALVAAALILAWIFLTPPPALKAPVVETPTDAVKTLTEGTSATDIAKDLESLSQEEALLGDLEQDFNQVEQQLNSEGL